MKLYKKSKQEALENLKVPRFYGIQGMLTGLLGNLSLLSYFAKKREKEAAVVQTLGVISTYVVLVQLTMAEAMPVQYFVATSAVVTVGLVLNCLFYFGKLGMTVWRLWEDFITVGGLSVLPQVSFFTIHPKVLVLLNSFHGCLIRVSYTLHCEF